MKDYIQTDLPTGFLSEDQLTCSICLEVFNNPVSTPCGHSFCQSCISSYWDRGGSGSKYYQCPLCKESFRKRPELQINRTLKEITEQFKQMANASVLTDGRVGGVERSHHHHPALSPPPRAGEMPDTIFAEMMARFQQLPVVRMPHTTQPSDLHPQSHSQASDHHDPPPPYSPPHRYSDPSNSSPGLPLCPIHLNGLEFFCRTDNVCVCSICVETAEHRGHNVTSAKREWHIKKSQLGITEVELKDLIREGERKVEEIHNSIQEIKVSVRSVPRFETLPTNHFCVIEMNLQAAEQRAESLLRELEQEIAELKKRSTTLGQLAVSEDYIFFFKTFPALSTPPQVSNWSSVSVSSQLTSGEILRAVNQKLEPFQEELQKLPEICDLSKKNPTVTPLDLLENITLDPSTAHPRLIISRDGKQVHCGDRHRSLPDNPERFDRVVCVLANQGFNSGRHYWEVEVGGKTDWDLGVASSSVNRKGKITVSPANGYWFLSLRDRTDYAFRTEPSTNLTVNPRPSRIGIYVDFDKGLVSFYNVEARVLIYTFTDCFSDTIHPFFSPCTNKSGQNAAPLIIWPVTATE
uniref:Bloodthirsty-related gene family, member 1 n=1 Tax=Stegastes partitus TaxID=144197 RepID=A0A3B5B3B3_9TELE